MTVAVGGYLEPNQLAGHEYDVRLSYTVEVALTVPAGHERQHAVDEADLRVDFGSLDHVTDWDLVHSDVDATEDIWADDPRAEHILGYCDQPTAPSEATFWDDTEHFDGETIAEYVGAEQ
ncbi:hypothetical protein [Haloarcula sp. JP-L23]|uniref:hypothetical protein n=1 Tax=Haloarcula sp. JP-L23 TaxID=2716717 RepID=UPI00140EFFBA|nr:hypothetical protein G9465_24705 [Haloarcula sp. JP-L23]